MEAHTETEHRSAASLAELRTQIRALALADEAVAVGQLLDDAPLTRDACKRVSAVAARLIAGSRKRKQERGTLDVFLQEFGLSNQEGIALMCLAEALLRIPDEDTADALIAEKIGSGKWEEHVGHSDSMFVNASTWALMLTGRVVELEKSVSGDLAGWVKRLVNRMGEPVIRQAMLQAMRIMGGEFVLGRTIEAAIRRGRKEEGEDALFSFDMLGEGARTHEAAERYFTSYAHAISVIARETGGDTPETRSGISVKLSALHPRYEYAQKDKVLAELLPKLKALAFQAADADIGFTIDAEEADRLDLSLDLIEALARDPELAGWDGLGMALQGYGKRAPAVADWMAALARETGRRFMVRLVKGAYWDTEIKRAQVEGLAGYPVFTRKANTDLGYIVTAARLLANRDVIFSQFATHNAHSMAAILEMAGVGGGFEFQRLHGMGELLYKEAKAQHPELPRLRIYAPVGEHEDLLAYLVRRLLENGANSSFVNRFMDEDVAVDELARDPIADVERAEQKSHAHIPLPADLYGAGRKNAAGIDLADPAEVEPLLAEMAGHYGQPIAAAPLVGGAPVAGAAEPVTNPADRRVEVGGVVNATAEVVDTALAKAADAQAAWDALGGAARADIIAKAGDKMEAETARLMALCVAEAGKTIPDALAEVREAVDFCRYYAAEARAQFGEAKRLPGPTGEDNRLSLHGRGVFTCIAPWNFPLAIFTGQVAAALAAGNAVAAKPAEQTPLIAHEAVRLFHAAGVPGDVLAFLPGTGEEVGARLVADPRTAGVAMTGSTETARIINQVLAGRDGPILPLIAETGGQNAMFVDSTALPEQVTDDVIASAFLSAGQRCSALRVLYLQEDIADKMTEMIAGAMAALTVGDPQYLATDIGPIIDDAAAAGLAAHADRMAKEARLVARCKLDPACKHGSFFAPRMYALDSLDQLTRERFGPILHVLRYPADGLEQAIADVRATGYGLTLGIHSRIEGQAARIFGASAVGNTYVNRNMVGAVVGVQPFGGQGLSGTGPKAGGPHYLQRFATERVITVNTAATGGNAALFSLEEDG